MDFNKIIAAQKGQNGLNGELAYKSFRLTMSEALSTQTGNFSLDVGTKQILAVQISANIEDQPKSRGTIRLKAANKDLFSPSTDCKQLMAGYNVPPMDRYTPIYSPVSVADNQVEYEYKDNTHPNVVFAAHTVTITFIVLK